MPISGHCLNAGSARAPVNQSSLLNSGLQPAVLDTGLHCHKWERAQVEKRTLCSSTLSFYSFDLCLLRLKVSDAIRRFHHPLRARAGPLAVCRSAPCASSAERLFPSGGPDRHCAGEDGLRGKIGHAYCFPSRPYSRNLGLSTDSSRALDRTAGGAGLECAVGTNFC